jgi:hypothetical protein
MYTDCVDFFMKWRKYYSFKRGRIEMGARLTGEGHL